MFFYLLSRNRSLCGVRPYVRLTCNPDADSWLARFLGWWIDPESGYPIEARSGVLRWMVRIGEQIYWASTPEELVAQHPGSIPKSVTFVAAKLTDNQILMQKDPGYLANLMALPLVERERLLRGNWKIRLAPGTFFRREWFNNKVVAAAPVDAVRVRYWDKAATEGGGCWTCGVLIARTDDGRYFVEHEVRGQWSPRQRDQVVLATAQDDRQRYGAGREPIIWLEKEGGSAGVDSALAAATLLDGFPLHFDRSTGSKETRAEPFAAQVEAGNVFLVQDSARPWDVHGYIDELCVFPQGPKDRVDATSGGYNKLVPAPGARVHGELFLHPTAEAIERQLESEGKVVTVGGHRVSLEGEEGRWWE